MIKYIEHIRKLAEKDPAYITPVPIDVKTMERLFSAFNDELTYIEYKFLMNKDVDVKKETDTLKGLYVFNYIIRHAYNWMTIGMGVYVLLNRYNGIEPISLQNIVFTQCSVMGNYAFYDGRSCKEVYEEVEKLKAKQF